MIDYSSQRIAAIKQAIVLGRLLQKDHPEIAEDYRNKTNAREIAGKYHIRQLYNAGSEEIAVTAVNYAISGNLSTTFGEQEYPGLISNSLELRQLARMHNAINGSRNGTRLLVQGRGIHAQTPEERRNSGLESAISRDEVPWVEQGPDEAENLPEVVYADLLTKLEQYKTRCRRYSSARVAHALNVVFHDGKQVRTGHAVYVKLSRHRKSKRSA